MNKTILSAALAAMIFPAIAQQPAENAGETQQATPNPAEFDKQLMQVQENINTMQQQMDKIRQTQDPQARQRLLQEHWTTMQSSMQLMHGMGGPGMMGGGAKRGMGMMGWGHMSDYSKLTPEQLKQRQYMTDQRLRMHQMMMDQIMQQNYWMGQSQPAPKGK